MTKLHRQTPSMVALEVIPVTFSMLVHCIQIQFPHHQRLVPAANLVPAVADQGRVRAETLGVLTACAESGKRSG